MCRKYWFEGYRPKPQGGTNFSGGTNNVLQTSRMGNKDKTLKHRKKKRRIFHGSRFTKLSGTAQISTPSCLSSSSTTLNKSQHDDIVCKSLSSKKLKLNLEHQITANDTNREEDLIDNIDPSKSSSSEDTMILIMRKTVVAHVFMKKEIHLIIYL